MINLCVCPSVPSRSGTAFGRAVLESRVEASRSRLRAGAIYALLMMGALWGAPAAEAQGVTFANVPSAPVNFGTANVCPAGQATPAPCSKTLTLEFNVAANTTIGSVRVLTLGAPGLDFQAEASDSSTTLCTAQTYTSATVCTVDVTFAPLYAGARSGAVQILDNTGNLLSTTNIYGKGDAPEIAFTPASQVSLTGGASVAFGLPSAVALDGSSNIFVADYGNDKVYEMLAASGYATVHTIADGFAFGGPAGVALDGSGNVFVADYRKKAVFEILAAGGYTIVNTLGGGFAFDQPTDVAVDAKGNLFVSDIGKLAVYELPASGGYSSVTQLAKSFTFGQPTGLAVDGSSNVFVSDLGPAGVYEIQAAGGYATVVRLASSFAFKGPLGVSTDASGNVFVADTNTTNVYEILATSAYTDVVPLGGGFGVPESITVDELGNVFVPDGGAPGAVVPAVQVIARSLASSLSFATTPVGGTSPDSPKSVQFQNIGNEPLTGTGALSDTTDFTVVAGSGVVPDCNGILSLAPGAECNVSFDFTPQSVGPLSSTLTLSDNALNGNPATHTVGLSGTGHAVPNITSISPNYGAIAAFINIAGFFGPTQGTSYVTVNGAKSQVTAWSGTLITIRVPYNGALGAGSVVVTENGLASNALPFTMYASPTVSGVTPAIGPVGTAVTITGANLLDGGGNASVTFNGIPATVVSDTAGSIVVDVPVGATSGQLRVVVNGVPLIALPTFTVTSAIPFITSVSPNYGAIAAFINIAGDFTASQGNGYVTVNGASSQVTAWLSSAITIRVPYNGALGAGSVTVTAGGHTSNAMPFTLYSSPKITSVSPTSGPEGTLVTITGTNLLDGGGNASVTFNGLPATIVSDTAGSISVLAPAGATSGTLRVEVNGVPLIALANFVVTAAIPNITGLSPNYGAIAAFITIAGEFPATQGAGYVTVNGASSQVTAWSSSAITIRVPYNGVLGAGAVTVTAGGHTSNALPFTMYASPTITSVTPTSGPVGTTVTIAGTNLLDAGGNASVTFNGTPATIVSDTASSIQVTVPAGATSGTLRVEVNGVPLVGVANFLVN